MYLESKFAGNCYHKAEVNKNFRSEITGEKIDKTSVNDRFEENKKSLQSQRVIDFDDLLPYSGSFGVYQILMFLSTMPFYFFGVFAFYSQIFLTEVSLQHWCWVPELANLTIDERRGLAIPPNEKERYGYDQCHVYAANWTQVLEERSNAASSWPVVPCNNGWEFDPSDFPYPTIASEMGWVCEKNTYQGTAQSIFFAGSICGGFIIGYIADRFGRIPAIVTSNLIGCIAGVLSTFAQNFAHFAASRFFVGISYDNCMMMSYLILLEYSAPQHRTLISNSAFALFYAMAAVALPWIALACGHWKVIALATSLPMGLAILAPLVLPESPRWLLTKGRIDDAVEKLLTIGRLNKKKIPPKLVNLFKQQQRKFLKQESKAGESLIAMLKRPLLTRMFSLICLEYMCLTMVFDGLIRTIGLLKFDFFVSFSLVSFTEFPALLLVAFIMDIFGRRWLIFFFIIVSGLFSFVSAFVAEGLFSVICAVIARFAVNMCLNTAIQWAAEMLPAAARGSGTSVVHTCGYIMSMVASYIAYLDVFASWLPMTVVGCIALISALIALGLPETAKKEMPQTFEETEKLILNQKFFEMPWKKNHNNAINVGRAGGLENLSFEP